MLHHQEKNKHRKMIDKSFIDSAKTIRKEFLELNDKIYDYEKYVKDLSESFLRIADDLENWRKNELKNEKSVNSVGDYMIGKLNEIEDETNKLNKRIEPINKKLEKLREEELKLYKKIKERYPTLSDEQIIRQIHENI